MSSSLRNQITFAPVPAPTTYSRTSPPPEKRRKMSITQTYFLAHTARSKLSRQAARPEHDLRLLVGHANLLDALTLDLQDAEREQDDVFNQTIRDNRAADEPKRVQFVDRIAHQLESLDEEDEDADASDSDSEVDSDDEDFYVEQATSYKVAPRRSRSPPPVFAIDDEDEDMYEDEDEDNMELALVRTHSHVSHPPELIHDHDSSDSEDEESPVTPPESLQTLPVPPEIPGIKARDFAAVQAPSKSMQVDGYYLPERQAPAVAAY